jgi:hypothetical protein
MHPQPYRETIRERLETREDWYLHSVRQVIQNVLANPLCIAGASELSDELRRVNKIQRGRPERLTLPFN